LNEDDYKLLCYECDNLLNDKNTSPERVSNSWLHIVREHPDFLKNYIDIFEPKKK